ncbi:hypothetical protein evm_004514 [Chilo suppressalis]|nr:hypothetical protein evm_004514 [Chilo suppressalis]
MLQYEQPVAEVKWRGKCQPNSRVLNDCNWCRCNQRSEYTCDARACSEVDMFGHFNDIIEEFDPGMEGHGAWRSTNTACEPLVPYRRGSLLCVCNEDGNWPNPVCRDIFRILHEVEVSGVSSANGQECLQTKLYLVSCNVCFCPTNGQLDSKLCTKRKCTKNDPVLTIEEPSESEDIAVIEHAVEIYADCEPDLKYKIGCQNCKCLRNNRLLCSSCTDNFKISIEKHQSFCSHVKPGQTFSRDCNLCYCDKSGMAYCSVKNCLHLREKALDEIKIPESITESDLEFTEEDCTPGYLYKKDCNTCYCGEIGGNKFFGCTLKDCERSFSVESVIHKDCVKGTMYELNCLICTCSDVNGLKTQLCHVNPSCKGKKALEESRTDDLNSLHGYCEPLHVYKKDCNTCTCLLDGKTVKCTSYECVKKTEDPISIDIVPIQQNGSPCPKGFSYKVDCNYCFCLSNGNALCTTVRCDKTV